MRNPQLTAIIASVVALHSATALANAPQGRPAGLPSIIGRLMEGSAGRSSRPGPGLIRSALARRDSVRALTEVKVTPSNSLDSTFGVAVAVDGDQAVVGASAFFGASAAYIFRENGSRWVEEQRLTPPDSPLVFGIAADIDGDRAVVVGVDNPFPGGTEGGLYIFQRHTSGQWQLEQKIVLGAGRDFGPTVEIQGTTIIAGGSSTESAFVFELVAGQWQQAQELTASDATADAGFGTSVRLEGNTLVVGAYNRNIGIGAAYVFARARGTWTEQQKLTASDGGIGSGFANFGVGIDGNTVAVGADNDGAVYVYRRRSGQWRQTQKITNTATVTGAFGFSVDLDEGTLVIGARDDIGGGATYVYRRSRGQFKQQLRIASSDIEGDDSFGTSVSLDGSTLVVGALGEGAQGAAYVYSLRVPGVPSLLGSSLGNPDFGGLGACSFQGAGIDGLPVVFDRQVAPLTVNRADFIIVSSTGARIQPRCVSFIPSINLDEGQTILTQGDYGPRGDTPLRVEIVGTIRSLDRTVNYRGETTSVAPFEVGGILVYARALPLIRLGGFQQCPVGTGQIIQLAFGSNAGNNVFQNTPANTAAFEVTLEDGSIVNPFDFADVLVDNYLELCLRETSPATVVEIAPGTVNNAGMLPNIDTLRAIVQQ